MRHKPITSQLLKPSIMLSTHNWEEFYYMIFYVSMGNGIDAVTTTSEEPPRF